MARCHLAMAVLSVPVMVTTYFLLPLWLLITMLLKLVALLVALFSLYS